MKDNKIINLQQIKDDRGDHDLEKIIETLRQRVKELRAINDTNNEVAAKLVQENQELKIDNKRLAKQVDDYYNAR
jgi:regulator of replication initiation timing|tara:strand:+ start:252 stop:476 length:225 start_codon:yes stop_codon:yes gene_type:complete